MSDDYSWTIKIVAGGFTGAGMIANSGSDGCGFITVPYLDPSVAPQSSAQFRFRDEGNTLQIDMRVPHDYDPKAKHSYLLSYDAATRTFKASIDENECEIVYTVGQPGDSFNDTMLKNLLGGYPSETSNFAGDFYSLSFYIDD